MRQAQRRACLQRGAEHGLRVLGEEVLHDRDDLEGLPQAADEVDVRDKARVAEAASLLRREPWCESIYCEDPKAACDRKLRELSSYFPGRSLDLMVDLDDDVALQYPQPGQHGGVGP